MSVQVGKHILHLSCNPSCKIFSKDKDKQDFRITKNNFANGAKRLSKIA